MPDKVRGMARVYADHIAGLTAQITEMTEDEGSGKDIYGREAFPDRAGVGLQTAMAIETFAPDLTCFSRGRDFPVWLGRVPKQNSTGGKSRPGRVLTMGQVDIRSGSIRGAMSVLSTTTRSGVKTGSWLERPLARKPKLVAAITLANRMARAIRAMMTKTEDCRNPGAVAQERDAYLPPRCTRRVRRSLKLMGD